MDTADENQWSPQLLANLIQSRYPEFRVDFPRGNRRKAAIAVAEIKYIEATGELCYFHLANNTGRSKTSITQTIGECQTQLEAFGFLRIHRQYLFNLSFFKRVSALGSIESRCGKELPIARRRRVEVAKVLAFYGL